MSVEYKINEPISTDQFIELLVSSSLGDRRPIQDRDCIEGMISNSNLTVSAWDLGNLVGLSRSITDFHYACYLSDLAVAESHQKMGIGKQLQIMTQSELGPRCKLILIAAPSANEYYEQIGFSNNERCWVLERDSSVHS
ncbi:MAG: GNAT family N-acetyltransferase [Alteromonadales bacterium]|nr:GNAT family N-acetyltransferase [Alteromonadales bacterium]